MSDPLHYYEGTHLGRYVYGDPEATPAVKAKRCAQCGCKWRPASQSACGCCQDEYAEFSVTEEHWFETEAMAQAEGF